MEDSSGLGVLGHSNKYVSPLNISNVFTRKTFFVVVCLQSYTHPSERLKSTPVLNRYRSKTIRCSGINSYSQRRHSFGQLKIVTIHTGRWVGSCTKNGISIETWPLLTMDEYFGETAKCFSFRKYPCM